VFCHNLLSISAKNIEFAAALLAQSPQFHGCQRDEMLRNFSTHKVVICDVKSQSKRISHKYLARRAYKLAILRCLATSGRFPSHFHANFTRFALFGVDKMLGPCAIFAKFASTCEFPAETQTPAKIFLHSSFSLSLSLRADNNITAST